VSARERPGAHRPAGSLIAFLAMAFVVVGLAGILATYAAPLPLARALHEEALLDDALAAGRVADIDAVAASLGVGDEARFAAGTADAAGHAGDLPGRVAALRAEVRQTMTAEANAAAWRLRFLIIVATIAGALFGAALLGAGRR
jgi:hypothetical protein